MMLKPDCNARLFNFDPRLHVNAARITSGFNAI